MNCYPPVIRRLTRPLRHHLRRHATFHGAWVASVACAGIPLTILMVFPPMLAPPIHDAAVNIPEPSALVIVGLGLANLAILRILRGWKR